MLTTDHIRKEIDRNFRSVRELTQEQIEIVLGNANDLAIRIKDLEGAREICGLLTDFCYDKIFFRETGGGYTNPEVRKIKAALALYYMRQHGN